ncbi:FAD-dependent oxidoreductase [Halobacteriales archaeon Cl-PHB]
MYAKRIDPDHAEWDVQTDFLVVGAGGCGMAAAVRAASRGVDVTVMEKADHVGGKALVATNQICAVDTQYQREMGIDDDAEAYLADLQAAQTAESAERYPLNHDLVETVAGASGPTIDWLSDDVGVDFELHTGQFVMAGHSVYRTHYPLDDESEIPRNGEPLIGALEASARDLGVEILTETPMDQLVLDESDDTVLGAIYKEDPLPEPRQQETFAVRADHVLLSCDGFAANRELVVDVLPELAELDYWGMRENTGEAVRIAQELDLDLDEPLYDMHGPFTVPEGVYLQNELVKAGAIMLNLDGDRFMDCGDISYRVMDMELHDQEHSTGFLVIDEDIVDLFLTEDLTRNQFEHVLDQDVFDVTESTAELAATYGLDEAAVEATIDGVNAAVREGADVEFGRAVDHALSPPFYSAKIEPMYVKARMGIKVTTDMQARRSDGTAVQNLYAGGNASESLEAGDPEAYIPGMDLMTAYTEGRLVGDHVAAAVDAD